MSAIVALLAALVLAASGTPTLAAPGDADGLNLDTHGGPNVWIEEHWDVKPGKLKEFVEAYDREIYALARQTPGYRGYSIATFLPQEPGEVQSTTRFGGPDTLIRNHRAIRLMGEIRTDKSINWDAVFGRTFNVLIIHNIATWADGDQFRQRMNDRFVQANPGKRWADQLASTVYPLVNNAWDAQYRLILTSWPGAAPTGPRGANDADGINLEPRQGPQAMIYEHWDVKPDRLQAFLKSYDADVYSVIRRTKGYRGYSIATSLPPQAWEKTSAPSRQAQAAMGGDDQLYAPRPGVMMDGTVRTNTAINVGALYKKTFNVMVMSQLQDWDSANNWPRNMDKIYADENAGAKFGEVWAQNLMPNANNHWDTYYRVIKTSFTPGAPGLTGK